MRSLVQVIGTSRILAIIDCQELVLKRSKGCLSLATDLCVNGSTSDSTMVRQKNVEK